MSVQAEGQRSCSLARPHRGLKQDSEEPYDASCHATASIPSQFWILSVIILSVIHTKQQTLLTMIPSLWLGRRVNETV